MRGMKVVWLGCLCASWLATPVLAEVYKWVDEKGVTHYSEKPPPNLKSKQVILREANPRQGGAAPPPDPGLKDKEIQFRQRQAAREQDERKSAQEKATRDDWCREARLQLADMKTMRQIYDLNSKGERVFMSDAEREAMLARREAELNQRCR